MAQKPTEPAVTLNAFNCPHCNAFTTQYWFKVYADRLEKNKTPDVLEAKEIRRMADDDAVPPVGKKSLREFADRLEEGKPFREHSQKSHYVNDSILGLSFSECYACEKVAIWHRDQLIYPPTKQGEEANQDFPAGILRDYEEARTILNLSPRGAAALLRLCVQKICKELGETEKNLDDAIASLVKKGLDPLIQHSLDSVRVIGNEAVHPGQLDMADNHETALELFSAVNLIVVQMISNPKKAKALYGKIPPEKREAIEKRDGQSKTKSNTLNTD